jgi:hypothetical protein
VKLTGALAAVVAAATVAACGGAASGSTARAPADQRLCAAAKALKQHPGILTSLAVIRDGKNATGPYRAAVVTFAAATIHGPRSAVTAAERKLFGDCGL